MLHSCYLEPKCSLEYWKQFQQQTAAQLNVWEVTVQNHWVQNSWRQHHNGRLKMTISSSTVCLFTVLSVKIICNRQHCIKDTKPTEQRQVVGENYWPSMEKIILKEWRKVWFEHELVFEQYSCLVRTLTLRV